MTAGRIAIIGGGPAGLMAAEMVTGHGHEVVVFEAMPTVGRKLLMAGKSGLNITHSEDDDRFGTRFGAANGRLAAALNEFDNKAVVAWCAALGVETFVGSSGRVFPKAMKASPLLRAWLARLAEAGVIFRTRHRWKGFSGKSALFETPDGLKTEDFDAIVLALGGASWPKLGSDGAWVPWLAEKDVGVAPLRPANCGFEADWSAVFAERFAGAPVKSVVATSPAGSVAGEFVITRWGIEGSLVYAHAAALRDALDAAAKVTLSLDLAPGRGVERLAADLARQKAKESLANRLRKGAGLDAVKAGLVREVLPDAGRLEPMALAEAIKALPLKLLRTRPMDEAISTAGGVEWAGIDDDYMLKALPGVFVAGEMLDWEAPTGGYLLSACLATGRAAGRGAVKYLERTKP